MKKKRFFVKKLTQDELSSLSDDELRSTHFYHNERAESLAYQYQDDELYAVRTELAYIQREIQERTLRFQIHEKYRQELRNKELEFEREEENLPVVNFDNFVPGRNNV